MKGSAGSPFARLAVVPSILEFIIEAVCIAVWPEFSGVPGQVFKKVCYEYSTYLIVAGRCGMNIV
jgi:hypothetical protein